MHITRILSLTSHAAYKSEYSDRSNWSSYILNIPCFWLENLWFILHLMILQFYSLSRPITITHMRNLHCNTFNCYNHNEKQKSLILMKWLKPQKNGSIIYCRFIWMHCRWSNATHHVFLKHNQLTQQGDPNSWSTSRWQILEHQSSSYGL